MLNIIDNSDLSKEIIENMINSHNKIHTCNYYDKTKLQDENLQKDITASCFIIGDKIQKDFLNYINSDKSETPPKGRSQKSHNLIMQMNKANKGLR